MTNSATRQLELFASSAAAGQKITQDGSLAGPLLLPVSRERSAV